MDEKREPDYLALEECYNEQMIEVINRSKQKAHVNLNYTLSSELVSEHINNEASDLNLPIYKLC